MDQNQNTYQQNPQSEPSNIPSSPPSPEDQVGVRSMGSDLQSIQQSGGEAPQSQIVSAPELSATRQAEPSPSYTYQPQQQTQPTESNQQGSINQEDSSSGLGKKIGWTVGIIVILGVLGFGAYYLVATLNQPTPAILEDQGALPLAQTPTPSPIIEETPEPTPEVLVHQSIITNPTKTEPLVISDFSLTGIKTALAAASQEKMIAGSIKELPIVDSTQQPIEALAFAQTIMPTFGQAVSGYIEKDMTAWLYADKIGGNKFGMIFKFKDGVIVSQVTSTIASAIEYGSDSENLFLTKVVLPNGGAFKEGVIEGIPVRYLAYNTKLGYVFEYGFVETAKGSFIVFATSYNQMLDIIKYLKTITTPADLQESPDSLQGTPQIQPITP